MPRLIVINGGTYTDGSGYTLARLATGITAGAVSPSKDQRGTQVGAANSSPA